MNARPDSCAGDAPHSKDPFAVDLNHVLGPACQTGAATPRGCCFGPLGYAGGADFGTPCQKVCDGLFGRVGSNDAYCERSDGSKYGNCFCGPQFSIVD